VIGIGGVSCRYQLERGCGVDVERGCCTEGDLAGSLSVGGCDCCWWRECEQGGVRGGSYNLARLSTTEYMYYVRVHVFICFYCILNTSEYIFEYKIGVMHK
jgi:hypothetical protein